MENVARGKRLVRSIHLALGESSTEGVYYVYHKLFGNFSWIDHAMYSFLASEVSEISRDALREEVGEENLELLVDSYCFVESAGEERRLVERHLAQRRDGVPSGRYLNGLQISSSNVCNFGCTYCFADVSEERSSVRRAIASSGKNNIDFDLAYQAIEAIRRLASTNGSEQVSVKFLGREPLVNWKVIRTLLNEFSDSGVQWAVTTNGSLITEEIAEKLKEHSVRTIVSLDGDARLNDSNRVFKVGGAGTYHAIDRGIRRLRSAGTPFGVSSVVSKDIRLDDMFKFIDHICEVGAAELELTLVMQTQEMSSALGTSHSEEQADFVEKLVELYQYAKLKNILVHGDWIDPFHRILTTHKFRGELEVIRPLGAGCSATSHQISIEPSGDLFPCRAMSTHYGKLDDLSDILSSDSYEKVAMRTFYNVDYCKGCNLEGFCQGTCLGSLEEASGNIYDPQEEYCDIYRKTTERLLSLFYNEEKYEKCVNAERELVANI